ncbi:MAG: PH domain-containing protein [Sedimentisphaerales bacterium]|nr:PH domain-containing protein [Sedimentisphaerales bacterium]
MAETTKKQPSNPNIDDMLPSDLISEDETVIFAIKPSLWLIVFSSFRTVVIALGISLAAMLLSPILRDLSKNIIEICGAIALVRLGYAVMQWVSRSYVLTNRRVIRIRGVFTIDIFQCALNKVQNTFMTLNLPQRFLGLGNIEFTTAGTGGIEAIWRHLRHPMQVHQQLIQALNVAANRNGQRPNPQNSPNE